MFSKSKWMSGGLWKPKNPHSLENLKYLYTFLNKNQIVSEHNRGMIVETLRSMSEILIWGDQNDSSVFDFFLEKNMLVFFLKFMRQKSGRYICVQLLQTLNILFDNIKNETSVYFLLSNNHINSIIVHKFDFSDEEVIAYYISFLKTLSLKLNKHTIHFFYNENTNDFALYTEAIKFFNHSESMVRIAVRTITLNVYKACHYHKTLRIPVGGTQPVEDKSMLRYIRDKTAAPYFSNLIWFIGNHVLELDACVRNDADHNSRDRLADLVAEHLDHLHYLNDILCLGIDALNDVLTDHLLNRLLLPLYIYSLTKRKKYTVLLRTERPHIHSVVSLFLLSQVFLILSHKPMVRVLMDIIFNAEDDIFASEGRAITGSEQSKNEKCSVPGFIKPAEPLADTLDGHSGRRRKKQKRPNYKNEDKSSKATHKGASKESSPQNLSSMESTKSNTDEVPVGEIDEKSAEDIVIPEVEAIISTDTGDDVERIDDVGKPDGEAVADDGDTDDLTIKYVNVTDEEKLSAAAANKGKREGFSLENRPYFEAIFMALECVENDYEALFALCLLYAMGHNKGVHQELMDSVFMPTDNSLSKHHYNINLIEKLIAIIRQSCENTSRVRLATLEMGILLLKQLVYKPAAPKTVHTSQLDEPEIPDLESSEKLSNKSYLQDQHLAAIEAAYEEASLLLRNFYKVWEKSEEIFLDMFQDEYNEIKTRPLSVEYLMMDASILLPPTGTPLTGIQFNKRLPCGEVERARRAIRVFFHIRDLSLTLRDEPETQLPLTKQEECVSVDDVLDLNNSDLIGCTVITRDNQKDRRFLVIDVLQLILVKPDSTRLGWGVVKFVGFLQDVEVTGDKDDSRSLHVTIHKPTMNAHARPQPLLCAKFVLDDHIRCMAAKQRLTKGRLKARQRKMQMIARLLQLPTHMLPDYYPAHQVTTPSATAAAVATAGAAKVGKPVVNASRTGTTGTAAGQQASLRGIPGRSHPVKQVRVDGSSRNLRVDQSSSRLQRTAATHLESPAGADKGVNRMRTASQASKHSNGSTRVSQPQNRNIQQLSQQGLSTTNKSNNSNSDSSDDRTCDSNIEEGQEAVPASPEAHAVQSLNPSSPLLATSAGRGSSSRSGSSSRPSSVERSGSPVQEIPLEDMGASRHKDVVVRVRSSSYSPRRFRKLSNSSASGERMSRSPARADNKDVEVGSKSGATATSAVPRGKSGDSRASRDPSKRVGLTSFTTDPNDDSDSDGNLDSLTESSLASEHTSEFVTESVPESVPEPSSSTRSDEPSEVPSVAEDSCPREIPNTDVDTSTEARTVSQTETPRRRTSSSSSCPKTLSPAEEPPASLLLSPDTETALTPVTSPKLIPPSLQIATTVGEPVVIATPCITSTDVGESKEATNLLSKLAQSAAAQHSNGTSVNCNEDGPRSDCQTNNR